MKNQPVENAIYAAIILECENLEIAKKYHGNGHHLAQRLSSMVSAALLPKQQKEIYEVLSKEPKSTKEISKQLNLESKLVSAQLSRIQETTMLVLSKQQNKKNKLWYRAE
jgi:predicted transcriptional regulator